MRRNQWLYGLALLAAGLSAMAEPDPEEVQRRMELYIREAEKEAAKKAPAPEPESKPASKPSPQPKPKPAVDYDHEAWKSAEKCGTAACFEAYLEDYPKGRYARMARARLKPKPEPTPRPVVVTPPAEPARPTQRFTDNDDGTVTDNKSGLIWLKDANCFGKQDWSTAMDLAKRLKNGQCGLRDGSVAGQWRLPSKREWEELVDKNADDPALPEDHPFTFVQSHYYWSSTTYTPKVAYAWVAYLRAGLVTAYDQPDHYYVWPVRDGR